MRVGATRGRDFERNMVLRREWRHAVLLFLCSATGRTMPLPEQVTSKSRGSGGWPPELLVQPETAYLESLTANAHACSPSPAASMP